MAWRREQEGSEKEEEEEEEAGKDEVEDLYQRLILWCQAALD